MKISARNVFKGKIVKITDGAINSEVIIEIAGGTKIASVITKESVKNLNLQVGKEAYSIIKASNVLIAID
ncbi:MAG: TOBE domain-containing protein [Lentisphaerota bacterium]